MLLQRPAGIPLKVKQAVHPAMHLHSWQLLTLQLLLSLHSPCTSASAATASSGTVTAAVVLSQSRECQHHHANHCAPPMLLPVLKSCA